MIPIPAPSSVSGHQNTTHIGHPLRPSRFFSLVLGRGDWVAGASQGGFDFAAVVLDGDSGDELFRWQNGTVGNDVIEFAQFDSSGELYIGGFSSAAWVGGAGDEDYIAIKFERLARSAPVATKAPTSSPTAVPTPAPSPPPTPTPTVMSTPAPSAASRDIPLPSPAPTVASTAALAVAEGGSDTTSSAVLERWAIGAIAAAAGVFLVLLALCESRLAFGKTLQFTALELRTYDDDGLKAVAAVWCAVCYRTLTVCPLLSIGPTSSRRIHGVD